MNENFENLTNFPIGMDEYQTAALDNAAYRYPDLPVIFPALGLAGEVGEYIEKLKDGLFPDEYVPKHTLAFMVWSAFDNLVVAARKCESLKKLIRRDNSPLVTKPALAELHECWKNVSNKKRADMLEEQCDTVWYEAALARDQDSTLGKLAVMNLKKIELRAEQRRKKEKKK